MIFPVGDDQVKGGSYPAVSYTFIAINIAVFIYQLTYLPFTLGYSVIPFEVLNGVDLVETTNEIPQAPGPVPIQMTFLFSMFMHGGWMHLLGNMLFLWIFADNIESTIGSLRFAAFYIIGGVIASAAHVASDIHSVVPSLGASGAIAAVMGAYLVMFPKSRIKLLILIFFRTFRIPAFVFLGFWIIQQLYSGVGSQIAPGEGGTAWWAHIGGFAFGVLMGFFFRSYTQLVQAGQPHYETIREPATRYNNRYITDRYTSWGDNS